MKVITFQFLLCAGQLDIQFTPYFSLTSSGQFLQSEWNLNLFQFEHGDFLVAHIERHFIISLKIKNRNSVKDGLSVVPRTTSCSQIHQKDSWNSYTVVLLSKIYCVKVGRINSWIIGENRQAESAGIHTQAFLACYSHRNKNTLYVGIFQPTEAPKSLCACSVVQLYPTLCNPMNFSPPGSSVHGILQVKILEWIAIFSPRGSSPPKDQTHDSCAFCTGRKILYP